MRSVIRFSLALLSVSTAVFGRVEPSVRISDPVLNFVPSARIAAVCATSRDVNACTVLDELALTCECEPNGGGWSTHSEFSAIARVTLIDSGYLTHEMSHIRDFRSLIRDYLTEIDAARYQSVGSCRSASVAVQTGFAKKLDEIRRISAFRRDHTPLAGSVRVRYEAGSVEVADDEAVTATGVGAPPAVSTIIADDCLQPYLQAGVMP